MNNTTNSTPFTVVAEGTYDADTDALVITEAQAPEATQAELAAAMTDTELTEVHDDLCQLISRSLTKAQADLVRSTRTVVENEIQRRTEVREAQADGTTMSKFKVSTVMCGNDEMAEAGQDDFVAYAVVNTASSSVLSIHLTKARAEGEVREAQADEVSLSFWGPTGPVVTYAKKFRGHVIECDGPEFYRIQDEVYEILVNDAQGRDATMSDDDLQDKAFRNAQRIFAGGTVGD